jgi:L-ribulose-5-phosphate 3-epimerase
MERNKIQIGIMQGRLSKPTDGKFQSFPKYTWKEEFFSAREAGLSNIEWIFEADEWQKNPISTDVGIKQIREVMSETGVVIESICADYFMDIPYFTASLNERKELSEKLTWLVHQVEKIDARNIDLPFVDASKVESSEQYPLIIEFISPALKVAEKLNINIALETNLNPQDFKDLLEMGNHRNLWANYDTGNSSGIGYDCREELDAYGKWIKTLHIKDRILDGGTMPLGSGSANFNHFFSRLSELKYKGPIILQAAREEEKEVTTAIKNRIFVEDYISKYSEK